ncbi:MAG: nucleoside triphosphate pyrophosphohydrolase [Spirochaetes bacterium RBG_16_49_21]|nr:MAG: nucleoside triphosphate pyrophosphohydrolase [Spirochaetes bacterium RBG_16_49_21]
MEFKQKQPLYILEEIAFILRSEKGCAWDKKQTPLTLRPYLIEEAYELYDAIEKGDADHVREELGDLLMQIYLHAQIAREKNQFTIDDVARAIIDKIIHRHPHVFGDEEINDADEVIRRWEKIKKKEKGDGRSLLEGVPLHLPALLKAYRVQQKVSRVGFDWERIEDVSSKLDEEVMELKKALESADKGKIDEEAGDILFSIANILRFININPEEALLKTIDKFIARFNDIEKRAHQMKKNLEDMDIAEMELLWKEAKDHV